MTLNHKRRRFVAEYLIDGNATRAATEAGYSAKTAYSHGQRLLKNVEVSAAVEAGQNEALAKAGLTVELVRNRLRQIISFDVRKLYDANGNLLAIQDLDDDTAAAVNGIEVQVERNRDEEGKVITTTHKVKTVDIARAVELGMRHFGLGKEIHEHTGKDGQPLIPEMSMIERARRVAFILMAAQRELEERERAGGTAG